jgi:hypothetical protein
MKRLYISIGLFFFFTNAYSQNYGLLNEGVEAIYEINSNSPLINNSAGSNGSYWIAAKRKTSAIVNGDTLIHHTSMAKSYEYDLGNNCMVLGDTSWMGKATIIQASGDYLFFNREGDTVRILPQAHLNDKWTAFKWQNGNYIEATVFNISLETLSTTSDSVKSIIFQVKNATHQNITHHFNGFQMRMSKNYGMVKSVNFFDFPNDTSSLFLVGHSNLNTTIRNITTADVYNFDVGDEFHVEGFSQDIPHSISFGYEIQRVLTKSISGDTLIYQIEKQQVNINRIFSQTSEDTTYATDTIMKIYLTNGFNLLDSLPYIVDTNKYNVSSTFYAPRYSKLEWSNLFNNKLSKVVTGAAYNIYPCISPILDAFPCEMHYIEGLGGGYYDCTSWGNRSTKELVFYKKNTETWGTPIDIQTLIPTSIHRLEIFKSIAIFPNPAINQITISTKNEIIKDGQISVFDGLGKTVWTSKVDSFQEKNLDIKNWAKGMYYVRIRSTEGIWTGKFIKQ